MVFCVFNLNSEVSIVSLGLILLQKFEAEKFRHIYGNFFLFRCFI